MLFSLMLWMPSWGGMLNGLLTLRGAWHKVAEDPILKFFVVAVTFYGMSTFEGPLLSIKSVNALSHYTDWTIAHVHGGALGWVAFLTFGMVYWLLPRVFQARELWSRKLAEAHFWIGTVGILLYIVSIYAAGFTQGLMWLAFDETGRLLYPDFVETTLRLIPMYWVRVIGGGLFILGTVLCVVNMFMTWRMRPASYTAAEHEAPALEGKFVRHAPAPSPLAKSGAHVADFAYKLERFAQATWHRNWEGLPVTFTVMTTLAVVVASLFEIVPTFLIKSNVPTIASVKPYTPLELAGRDLYVSEGCYNCHSQMVRPIRAETVRYGEYSKPGEFVYDRPFQWGSRRIGPDLHRVGGKYPHLWHVRHMEAPRSTTPQSIMPAYPWLLEEDLDFETLPGRLGVLTALGVPYGPDELARAVEDARDQAGRIAAEIKEQGGAADLQGKKIAALIAYLQRLGTDIHRVDETRVAGQRPSKAPGTGVEGLRRNNCPDSGRRGARLARRDDEGVAELLRGGATPPDGMHRRSELGSYFFADPE
jgi:cytochrome c oxidase cbb3-type subunit I/II